MENGKLSPILENIAQDPMVYYKALSMMAIESIGSLEDVSEETKTRYRNVQALMQGLQDQSRINQEQLELQS